MNRLSAATEPFATEPFTALACAGPADGTIAARALAPVGRGAAYADAGFFWGQPHESETGPRTAASAVAALAEAFAARVKAALFEFKPGWRVGEEEVARAAIVVIFFALMTIISLAAGAILTMG
ncbi:hypothetical protein HMPREF0591_5811 [Mycobacterium parascrofulaceum ATCC BAA-614]|uniref:Uncharacterized protein n=1 Tax=Mycobacterium parascrofulaceum ATCC BAA-614 TaxID=525368 RepID=D5PI17_9MYCO|nr:MULTISPECIES: hypothetical protein [Mycobacterium]EFG74273.1 hypothetical protein HMPREF0591_5811 [Mycobacterium parascrofulaceum ATCC BAA-614]OCB41174.1 hypothetical protein A9X02_16315 [Mycobacterium malmoense]